MSRKKYSIFSNGYFENEINTALVLSWMRGTCSSVGWIDVVYYLKKRLELGTFKCRQDVDDKIWVVEWNKHESVYFCVLIFCELLLNFGYNFDDLIFNWTLCHFNNLPLNDHLLLLLLLPPSFCFSISQTSQT